MSKKTKNIFNEDDRRFMLRALELAQRGLGRTSPNPVVGAVLVKNGKIVGEGYHRKAGFPHAEVEAIKGVKKNIVKGSVLYVTLEPCCHFNKRTPPCTGFLAESGIKAVVSAMRDPNRMVDGKGFEILKKAGIKVSAGLCHEEAKKINEVYIKTVNSNMPFVILKMAVTIDGKIALGSGESRWISNRESRKHVHELRNIYDAILTSSSTVLSDNPHLGVRMVKGRDPLRIILDRTLKTDPKQPVYRDKNVLIVTAKGADKIKMAKFNKLGFDFLEYEKWPSMERIFSDLRKRGICSIMIEAGPAIAASLIKAKLVDKYLFFVAPKIMGNEGIGAIANLGIKQMSDLVCLNHVSHRKFGDDVLIEGYL